MILFLRDGAQISFLKSLQDLEVTCRLLIFEHGLSR